jgi:hypothetical protein
MLLWPIKKESKYKSFGVFDIESRNWIDFVVIGAYSDATEGFTYFDSLEKFFEYIFECDLDVWFAHFGGKFDFLFLLQYLFSKKGKDAGYRLRAIIPRGSMILTFSVYKEGEDKVIKFWDSSALLSFSLKSLTENFDVETKKGSIDYDKIDKITSKLLEYLKSDCIGLHEVLTKFYNRPIIKKAGQAFTIAGQAMKVYRTMMKSPIADIPRKLSGIIRKSYVGGRTEIFRPYYNNKLKFLYCYDVNSLYPAVMRNNRFPHSFCYETNEFEETELGFYDLDIYVPDMYCPPLPCKTEDNKLIFPTGVFRGIYTIAEINNALKYGCRIKKIHNGYIFNNAGFIFKDFINNLYTIREAEKKKNLCAPSVDDITAKLLMNSLYGRFGINDNKELIRFEEGKDGEKFFKEIDIDGSIYNLVSVKNSVFGFSNVAISAYVTSYARIFMYDYYMQCGNELYYTDTDSCYVSKKLKTGNGLGELKLEEKTHEAVFVLPKTYKTDNKMKMKGFDRKITNFNFEDFSKALQGELYRLRYKEKSRVMTFKSALKRKGKVLTMTDEMEKRVLSVYDKRIFIKHNDLRQWDTKPIIVGGEDVKNW